MSIISVVPGNVTVDSSGVETYTPNDATNAAKALYLRMLAGSETITKQSIVPGSRPVKNPDGSITPGSPPTQKTVTMTVTPTPTHKQAIAAQAVIFAAWHVTDVLARLGVTVTIPNTSGGDGLQTSATAGSPSTHPSSPKNITGGLT